MVWRVIHVLNRSIRFHLLELVLMHIVVFNQRNVDWIYEQDNSHLRKLIWVVFNEICDRLFFGSETGWNNNVDDVSINVWRIGERWFTGRIYWKLNLIRNRKESFFHSRMKFVHVNILSSKTMMKKMNNNW